MSTETENSVVTADSFTHPFKGCLLTTRDFIYNNEEKEFLLTVLDVSHDDTEKTIQMKILTPDGKPVMTPPFTYEEFTSFFTVADTSAVSE